jgi:hypothetical protein
MQNTSLNSISQLIQERQPVKVKSERAELVKFFVEKLKDKQGKPFPARRIAVALGHIPTKDIYYIISIFKDTEKRRGLIGASKEFWFSIKSR